VGIRGVGQKCLAANPESTAFAAEWGGQKRSVAHRKFLMVASIRTVNCASLPFGRVLLYWAVSNPPRERWSGDFQIEGPGLTNACSRLPTASAALPLPAAAEA
jgi:hypothetical protein